MEESHSVEEIDLSKYWSVIKRNCLPAMTVALIPLIASLYLAINSEKEYEASGKLKFKKENITSSLVTEAGEKIGKLDSLKTQDTPLDTEAEILRSAPIINQVITSLNIQNKQGELLEYEDFLEKLKVINIPGTDILTVSYRSPQAKEAQRVVNQVMENYLKNNISLNRADAGAAKQFLSQQIPLAEKSLKEAEKKLEQFKTNNQVVDLQGEANLLVQQIGQIDQQISQLQGEVAKVQARSKDLRTKVQISPQEVLTQSNVNNSIAVQDARIKLQEAERKLAVERQRYKDNYPTVVKLKEEVGTLKNLLAQTVEEARLQPGANSRVSQNKDLQDSLTEYLVNNEAEAQGLLQQLAALRRTKASYAQRAKQIPQLEQNEKVLDRQVTIAQNSYQALIKSLQEIEIAEKQQVGNAQVISTAIVSKYPQSARKKFLALGLASAALTYLLTAFLLELTDSSIKTLKEARKIFPYPWLGSLPEEKHTGKLPLKEQPNSLTSEAYRRLVAQGKVINAAKNIRTVIITSSIPEEEKSTVTANLALAEAELGTKVLLIDADFRHPQQEKIWQLTSGQGLGDILAEETALSLAVKTLGKNLDIIFAGSQVINPLHLVDGEKMKNLLRESLEIYDLVIIDTPPLLLNTMALNLSPMTDGIILVAKLNRLDRNAATEAQEMLKKFGSNILGLIINGVRTKGGAEQYFRYGKSYFIS